MHHTHTGVHRPGEDVRLPEPGPTGGCELSTSSSQSQTWRPEPSAGAASAASYPASPPLANIIPDSHHQAWTDYEIHWEHIHFYFSRNQGQRCSSFLTPAVSNVTDVRAHSLWGLPEKHGSECWWGWFHWIVKFGQVAPDCFRKQNRSLPNTCVTGPMACQELVWVSTPQADGWSNLTLIEFSAAPAVRGHLKVCICSWWDDREINCEPWPGTFNLYFKIISLSFFRCALKKITLKYHYCSDCMLYYHHALHFVNNAFVFSHVPWGPTQYPLTNILIYRTQSSCYQAL